MTEQRLEVEWVRPWGPLVVAAGTAALVCFLVSEDAAFLGASWGVLVGAVVALSTLWLGGVVIWVGMLCGGLAALLAGPLLTALVRVRLVPAPTDWESLLRAYPEGHAPPS